MSTYAEIIEKDLEQRSSGEIQTEAPEQPAQNGARMIVRASDLLRRNVTELPKLFAPVFPAVGVAMLGGESCSGKSMLLRNMAICTATGRDFLGWKYQGTHKSCIFVSTEDDEVATSFLLGKHNATFADYADDWNRLRFIFDFENLIPTLDAELTAEPADLVVIDAYLDVFDGSDQNNATQNRKFLHSFYELSKKHKCLIIFLHHTGKGKENLPPSKNNFVGSQSLEAKVRLGIEFRMDKHNEALRHFCIVKANGLDMGKYGKDSFVLKLDENLVYHNTGERVSFEDLGTPKDYAGNGRGKWKPSDIPDETLKLLLKSVLSEKSLGTNGLLEALKPLISNRTHAAATIHYAEEEKHWIKNISQKQKKEYILCI